MLTARCAPVSGSPTFWFSSHNFGGRNPCSRTYVIYWGPRDRSKWSSLYIAPGEKLGVKPLEHDLRIRGTDSA